jgi:hypothetical protein
MVSVIAVVDLDSEEVVVAQVSSTFTVVLELNMDDIDFNYLPMDAVCNGPSLPSIPAPAPLPARSLSSSLGMHACAHAGTGRRTCAHARGLTRRARVITGRCRAYERSMDPRVCV